MRARVVPARPPRQRRRHRPDESARLRERCVTVDQHQRVAEIVGAPGEPQHRPEAKPVRGERDASGAAVTARRAAAPRRRAPRSSCRL
jgi:hypothetical protein